MKRHIFDENFPAGAMQKIREQISSVVQIGQDWGKSGWLDVEEILPQLHGTKATFHTLDGGFFKRRYRHESYGVVYYDVVEHEVEFWIIKFLRHRDFKTHAQRLGKIVKVAPAKLTVWALHQSQVMKIEW